MGPARLTPDRGAGPPPPQPRAPDGAEELRRVAVRVLKQRLTWTPSVAHLCSGPAPDAHLSPGPGAEPRAPPGQDPSSPAVPLLPSNRENLRQLSRILGATCGGAGNSSVLLLGPRGTGKSLVVYEALQQLLVNGSSPTEAAAPAPRAPVVPVYINGRLIADDQQALAAIAARLEEARAQPGRAPGQEHSTAATGDLRATLEEFCCSSSAGAGQEKSRTTVVLVLDEFDLFTARPRQSLLYSVFDSLQSPDLSLSIVGITCRQDAEQLLEKRVRSRHSGRKIIFSPPPPEDLLQLAKQVLRLPPDLVAGPLQGPWQTFADEFNRSAEAVLGGSSSCSPPPVLAAHFHCDSSPPGLLRLLFRAVGSMDSRQGGSLQGRDLEAAAAAAPSTARLGVLLGLSILELFLLVAVSRLEQRQRRALNFTMVFEEYRACATQGTGSSDLYSEEAARMAFQRLQEQGLLVPATGAGAGSAGRRDLADYAPVQSEVFPLELEVALERHKQCPLKLKTLFAQGINPGLSSQTLW